MTPNLKKIELAQARTGLTLRTLAEAKGVPVRAAYQAIYKIRHKQHVRLSTLGMLANLLGVPLEDICNGRAKRDA